MGVVDRVRGLNFGFAGVLIGDDQPSLRSYGEAGMEVVPTWFWKKGTARQEGAPFVKGRLCAYGRLVTLTVT